MDYRVRKLGSLSYDMCHAYGLGLVLAQATRSRVMLVDDGTAYRLTTPDGAHISPFSLRELLPLPEEKLLMSDDWSYQAPELSVGIFDGLLAASFTLPGIRVNSVNDLWVKSKLKSSNLEIGLHKIQELVARLERQVLRTSRRSESWLSHLLSQYLADRPESPIPFCKNKGEDIIVPMAIEPMFSYASRQPLSDGLIAKKSNIALRGTGYGAVLGLIGASRILRTQRVAGGQVNLYIPLAQRITVEASSILPILRGSEYFADQALIIQWLKAATGLQDEVICWDSIVYQTMQTQGVNSSISIDRGVLSLDSLASLNRIDRSVTAFWLNLLGSPRQKRPIEIDDLLDSLLRRRLDRWTCHLQELAMLALAHPNHRYYCYNLDTVKEIVDMLEIPSEDSLRRILSRPKGTLRFGRALRLLRQVNPAPVHDIIDRLDVVQTRDTLIRILAQIVQECAFAAAKSEFIIVPDENDFICILEDIELAGVSSIAKMTITLAWLRYPRSDEHPIGKQEDVSSDSDNPFTEDPQLLSNGGD
jgi:hypothetical protein